MNLISYEHTHLDAIMADLRPVLRPRLDAVEGFDIIVQKAPYAVTIEDDGPVGCAWFFPITERHWIVTALSSNRLKARREFLPICREVLDAVVEAFEIEELSAHVHSSFKESAAWVEKLGFKAVGYHDELTEYRYETSD